MSGGHFEYSDYHIQRIAEMIENEIEKDFKYESWEYIDDYYNTEEKICDRLDDATPEQRIEIINIAKELLVSLKKNYEIAHELDYLLSGDTSSETFLKRISKLK